VSYCCNIIREMHFRIMRAKTFSAVLHIRISSFAWIESNKIVL
jgi:hypothetical protein